jgi:hypothetical protein
VRPEQQALAAAHCFVQNLAHDAGDWQLRPVGTNSEPDAYLCAGTLFDRRTVVVLVRLNPAAGCGEPVAYHWSGISLGELDARLAQAAGRALGTVDVLPGRLLCFSPLDLWQEFLARGADPRRVLVSLRNLAAVPMRDEVPSVQFRPAGAGRTRTASAGVKWLTGVPDWDWHYGCAPTAAANVLTWWAARGYERLLDSVRYNVPDRIEGDSDSVPNVSAQLATAMNTDTLKTGSTMLDSIVPGLLAVCNDPAWSNYCDFTSVLAWNDHDLLIAEIDAGRPGVLGLLGHPEYGSHAVTFCGWGPPDDRWIMVHDLWGGTPTDRVINFDYGGPVAVVAVVPGKSTTTDLAVAAIVQPAETVAPGAIRPQARIANFGSSAGTGTAHFFVDAVSGQPGQAVADARCYAGSSPVAVEPGKEMTVTFPVWDGPVGEYVACCSLEVSSSANPANDVLRRRFTIDPAAERERLEQHEAPPPALRMYPNPARGLTRLQLPGSVPGNLDLRIYNASGRLMVQSAITSLQSEVAVDASILLPGVYLVQLDRAGRTRLRCSFVVER